MYTSALDTSQTETKGTVLIKNANEMLNFTTGEEKQLEKVIHLFGTPFNISDAFPRLSKKSLILGSRLSLEGLPLGNLHCTISIASASLFSKSYQNLIYGE